MLEPLGAERVRIVRDSRDSKVGRNRAARQAVLSWTYESNEGLPTGSFPCVNFAYFGTPFTEDHLIAATDHLEDAGFVQERIKQAGYLSTQR